MYATNGAREAIAAWLTVRGPEPGPLFVPVDKAGRIVLRRLTAESVFDRLAYLAKRAGVQRFSPRDMRRSFISDLLDKRRGPRPVLPTSIPQPGNPLCNGGFNTGAIGV